MMWFIACLGWGVLCSMVRALVCFACYHQVYFRYLRRQYGCSGSYSYGKELWNMSIERFEERGCGRVEGVMYLLRLRLSTRSLSRELEMR
jgi:hypothetical protein